LSQGTEEGVAGSALHNKATQLLRNRHPCPNNWVDLYLVHFANQYDEIVAQHLPRVSFTRAV